MQVLPDGKIGIPYRWSDVPTVRRFCKESVKRVGTNPILGLMGPFGSGKSTGCIMTILKHAWAQKPGRDGIRRTRWAIVRNTYGQLKDTTINTFLHWFPPQYFGRYNKTDHDYFMTAIAGCHIEFLFRALDRPDHVANLLSLEVTGAWFNEVKEIPWVIIEAMHGRVGRFPAMEDGGPSWWGLLLDTNPPDEDSEFFDLFENKKPDNMCLFKQPPGLRYTIKPDGGYNILGVNPKAENVANLVPDYYVNTAKGKGHEYIKVFMLGQYGFSIDGKQIFPEYNDNVHFDNKLQTVPRVLIKRGWDFGLTPACVFTQFLPAPRLLVIDELCATHMSVDKFVDEVLIHSQVNYPGYTFEDWGDPSGNDPKDTDMNSCFKIMRAKGIAIKPGLQNVKIRLESVRYGLTNIYQGLPALMVGPKCKMIRKGFMGGYHFRRMRLSIEKYHDKPEKNEYSHPMDALEYICTRIFGKMLSHIDMPDLKPLEQRQPDEAGAYF